MVLKFSAKTTNRQSGQTLIETMVAIFILVMGIVAALGLALYSFNASSNITQQIVAIGLAREGIEAVKNIRDTNWLKQAAIDTNCHNYATGLSDAKCYRNWQTQWLDIDPSGGNKPFALSFDPTDQKFWQIKQNPQSKFGLNFDSNIAGVGFRGFYSTDVNNPPLDGSSIYYRTLTISEITTAPFDADSAFPELLVNSQVWWRGPKCPAVQTYDAALPACRVEVQTILTNWKNY